MKKIIPLIFLLSALTFAFYPPVQAPAAAKWQDPYEAYGIVHDESGYAVDELNEQMFQHPPQAVEIRIYSLNFGTPENDPRKTAGRQDEYIVLEAGGGESAPVTLSAEYESEIYKTYYEVVLTAQYFIEEYGGYITFNCPSYTYSGSYYGSWDVDTFDTYWREFPGGTAKGTCEHITTPEANVVAKNEEDLVIVKGPPEWSSGVYLSGDHGCGISYTVERVILGEGAGVAGSVEEGEKPSLEDSGEERYPEEDWEREYQDWWKRWEEHAGPLGASIIALVAAVAAALGGSLGSAAAAATGSAAGAAALPGAGEGSASVDADPDSAEEESSTGEPEEGDLLPEAALGGPDDHPYTTFGEGRGPGDCVRNS